MFDAPLGLVIGYALMLVPGMALAAIVVPLALLVEVLRLGPRPWWERYGRTIRAGPGR